MKIELKTLTLENFKGIKALTVHFDENTTISGDNGTGKSTIFDSFTYLLFGKDSHNSADFNIKTLDENNNAIPKLDHSVTGVLLVDGVQHTLKRTYREKWVRRRGSEETTLDGHETLFEWNAVPLQAGEYKAKIDALVSEGLFKLLTSPLYFNSLKWEQRRAALLQIAGEVDNEQVFKSMTKGDAKEVLDILNSGKNLLEYRKEVAAKKRKLNDELKLIPARVDEVVRAMPLPVDAVKIESDLRLKRAELKSVEDTMQSEIEAYNEKNKEIQGIQSKVHQLKSKLSQIRFDQEAEWGRKVNAEMLEANKAKREHDNVISEINNYGGQLEKLKDKRSQLLQSIESLRDKWEVESEKSLTISEDEFVCPVGLTCKKELYGGLLEERKNTMLANFEKTKSAILTSINVEGQSLAAMLKEVEGNITEHEDVITALDEKIKTFVAVPTAEPKAFEFTPTEEYNKIQQEADEWELQVLEVPKIDTEGLKQQKATIQQEIDELKRQLTIQEQIVRGEKRKQELLNEESSLAQQVANLEKQEFAMDNYTKVKMTEVERRVNEKFAPVTFKMFQVNLNGGEEPICETMINGVPYYDANSAAQIQVGLSIINTMSDHYGIYLTCFVDNRERVNVIPRMKCQVVNLVVTKDKELVIN